MLKTGAELRANRRIRRQDGTATLLPGDPCTVWRDSGGSLLDVKDRDGVMFMNCFRTWFNAPEGGTAMPANDPLDYTMPFGKHKDKSLWWIACNDPTYLDWASDNLSGVVRDKVREALEVPDVAKRIDAAVED